MDNKKVQGRFSTTEDKFIKDNYVNMTDQAIAESLDRSLKSVQNRKVKLKVVDKQSKKLQAPADSKGRKAFVASLDDKEREKFFLVQIKRSSMYKQIIKVLRTGEIKFYEEKYVEFMTDPTIETMTAMEKDALHEMTIAQIRIVRLMEAEQNDIGTSKAREIRDCQDVVQKCQESLNVQRKQRLRNSSDQAINFTSLIKELKDPRIRREVGYEAVMLKFMAEQYYNDHLSEDTSGNIVAGRTDAFDVSKLFKNGTLPSGLSSEFS